MQEVYARIDGVDLYLVAVTPEELGILQQSKLDFLRVPEKSPMEGRVTIAASLETLAEMK